ncbi:MAG: DoxX family protein [Candidatus Riflebacteria bacterium]|nr:DoxX family protein [Candidatus Riflebacteria bacterium]
MSESSSERFFHWGVFVLRVGIGIIMMGHGIPKLMAGPELWEKLGMAMGNFGIHFFPAFWGFMCAVAEGVGGLLLLLGLFVRIASGFMTFNMCVAISMHLFKGDTFQVYSHPLSLMVVFLSLMIMGGGCCSAGAKISCLEKRWYQ